MTRPLRVLLVDDSEDDVLIVRRAFKVLGLAHELVVLSDGEDVLRLCEAAEGEKRSKAPDLVLMDVNLPRVGGIRAAQALRSDPVFGRVPITMLSASGRDADIEQSRKAGADQYIVKPLRFEEFVRVLDDWNRRWSATRSTA